MMADTTDQSINSEIRDNILDAAIKRFSWFGINKTTMTEIADDIPIPRHSLTQFFHDKGCLIAAVEEKVVREYLDEVQKNFIYSTELIPALKAFVRYRLVYLEKYFRFILPGEPNEFNKWSNQVVDTLVGIKEMELNALTECLSKFIDQPEKYAAILLDTLRAYEAAFKTMHSLPTELDFQELANREIAVIKLMAQGLQLTSLKNQ